MLRVHLQQRSREHKTEKEKCWENWIATNKNMKLNKYLKRCMKINSIWLKYLDADPECVK